MKRLAATYLQPNKARRVFPCWDEPEMFSSFHISVRHHQKYNVLSNWPIRKQYNVENDMKWTHFKRAYPMSTYIVGIVIVSNFAHVSNTDQSVNVWCRSSLTSQARFVLSIAERIMPLLEKYIGRINVAPKIDHVIVPGYPKASMGDWGIIIYKESKVVYDDSKDPTFRKRNVASHVANGIAHQWFGTFLTLRRWTDIWLIEGFAVYFQVILCCVIVAPAILRMLHHAVGDEVFRKGITKYFARHRFDMAVTPYGLWIDMQSAKDEVSYVPYMQDQKFTIEEVMHTWIVQNRYPVLNVTMNYKTGEVAITQKSFHATEDINNKWWIPISYTDASSPDFSNTMPNNWLKPNETLRVQINTRGWIIVNLQQTAYCRVYYDTTNMKKIIRYLNSEEYTKIHVLNRAQIIDDAYAFLLEDQLDSSVFINLINYLKRERDYVAWIPMFQILKRNEKYFSLPESEGFKTLGKLRRKLTNNSCSEFYSEASNTTLFKDEQHALIFNLILQNHARNNLVLDYILANFNHIKRNIPGSKTINYIIKNVFSDEQMSKVKRLAETRFHQMPEILSNIIDLIEQRKSDVEEFKYTDMVFSKLLLHIGHILVVVTISCIADDSEIIHRLPNNTVLVIYNISLIPHLKKGNTTFHGKTSVIIDIIFDDVLHSQELEINKAATTLINGTIIYKPKKHIYNNETNILTLHFNEFVGNFPKGDFPKNGFMKILYTDQKEDNTLAAAFFKPNSARRMFPCWDKPGLKATFSISVMHRQEYKVMSNMLVQKQYNVGNGMMWTHFHHTPTMSTYLVEIVIVPNFFRVGNAVSVWCKWSLQPQARFVRTIAEKVVPLLEWYTDRFKGTPKIDHVIVQKYPVNGMETWGLIIYDESKVVYDESTNPTFRRKRSSVVILAANKLVHQWFSQLRHPILVVPRVDKRRICCVFRGVFPQQVISEDFFLQTFEDWRTMDFLVTERMHDSHYLNTGSLDSVTLKLHNTLEYNELFGNEVFNKGKIIQIIIKLSSENTLMQLITMLFLKFSSFGSVTSDDLWNAMQNALQMAPYIPYMQQQDFKIKDVMDTWINQNRYPVLNVTINYETGEVAVNVSAQLNWIPMTYADQSNLDFSRTMPNNWLGPNQTSRVEINTRDWIIVNVQQTGFTSFKFLHISPFIQSFKDRGEGKFI
ncbi:Aminopeptidase N [Temnothorax longispinosus]|uniref:Aminopeptidase N n=1 Tax=Temnothorax longispinosus TaxID=300112 RepID=A0A4S2KIM3_9HYME|nr:Aminopeptidase N [Temnothorax longispinosus]